MRTIGAGIEAAHPDTNKDLEPFVRPFIETAIASDDKQLLQTLLGAVAFVLLIACANVANLLLSRAIQRVRETSIRIAVGASRWRVIRQLLVESVLLSAIGGAIGFLFAKVGVRMFAAAVAPLGIPYWFDWSMDTTAFLYLLGISVGSGIAFGLAPALQVSKANIQDSLKETGRTSVGAIRSRSFANALIVVEISLTVVLMVGGGLMIRSSINRQSVDVGIPDADHIVTMQLILGILKYPQPADRLAFEQRLMERLRNIRDLQPVTIASHIPADSALQRTLSLPDRNLTDANGNRPSVAALTIEAGYFHALGLAMIRGREFSDKDGVPGAEAVIVNSRFASQY
jgi:predicted permease